MSAGFHRALPWLLAGLVLTLLPLIGQVPAWALVVFGGCTVWRYWLEVTRRALPSLLGRMFVFLPIAYLVVSNHGSTPGSTGLLTFLIALLSLKILELRTPHVTSRSPPCSGSSWSWRRCFSINR